MRFIGWIGVFHVFIIVAWMIINIIFSLQHPVTIQADQTISDAGIAYYSDFPGYLGFDHGSKALIMLFSIALPIGLFMYLRKSKSFQLNNLIALIAGCLGFSLYGLSLMVQAATVEYAFKLFKSTGDVYTRNFATLLYEWSMLEGGLSVSIYILANLLLTIWMIIHSVGLYKNFKILGISGIVIGGLQAISYLISWSFLMQGKQNMHDLNETVGLFMMVWILFLSIRMIRGDIHSEEPTRLASEAV